MELQNSLFEYFSDTLTAVIAQVKKNGNFDEGIMGESYLLDAEMFA